MDVLHTALWVDDVESMKSFYNEGLELEHTREFVGGDDATNYFLAGESDTEIQFKFYEDEDEQEEPAFDHVGIEVDDVDERIETLTEEFGSEVTRGPKTIEDKNVRIAFVTDPEGHVVELIERTDE